MEIKHVSKQIRRVDILRDIDFSAGEGNIIGLVGRNGAGKTTLLRTMAGILKPTHGDVLIDGKSIFKHPEIKEKLMFVPDSSEAMKNYSTKELVYLYRHIYPEFDVDHFDALMYRFGLERASKIGHYSKGMSALFSLILAFSTNARYILLDEPTDGLDVIIKRQVLQMIVEEVAEKETSVIISSHRLDELEYMVNEVVLIKDGKVNSHYQLDDMKKEYRKMQAAFDDALPEDVASHVHILEQTGRVYTLLVPRSDDTFDAALKEARPIFYEELPMSLEDYFVAKLGGKHDV
ncbi:ABC transporter ATP-binding protein [Alkalicoccus urumqiensis]|uniref:ABC transporter ATP-binding protein n=2 Tax=Alkalicoccus urumqiensis TaxID=1548213 RepID=A0A2P6MEN7_ALKUR|nr:ABC transporter ATP-binding protein [Alkalicoccus urumqiensis]